jgi:hypothetical protein
MSAQINPFGSVSIVPANHGSSYVCAVKMNIDDEGFFGAIDLGPDEARAIALQLLEYVGAIDTTSLARETALGARH